MGSALFPCSTLFLRLRTSSFFFFNLIVVVMPCLFIFILHRGLQGRKRIEKNSRWTLWTVTEIPLGPLFEKSSLRCWMHTGTSTQAWPRSCRGVADDTCTLNAGRVLWTHTEWPWVTGIGWNRKGLAELRHQMHTNRHFWSCCAWGSALPKAGGHCPRLVADPAQQHLDLSRCLDVPLAQMTEYVRDGGSTFGHCMTQPTTLWGITLN